MRIISGKFKGRRLTHFKAPHIRPTTDRVKESVFNILQGSWADAKVLDLFSGTGSLGLEALSREAKFVMFVEQHPLSLKILNENLEILEIDREHFQIQKRDVRDFLKKYKGDPFDVILIDPPFTEKMAHEVMEHVAESRVWVPGTVIMIESARQERIDQAYGDLRSIDSRHFGDKLVTFFGAKETV